MCSTRYGFRAVLFVAIALAAVLGGCKARDQGSAAVAAPPADEAKAASPAPSSGGGRDLSHLDLCALFDSEQVASVLGGTVGRQSSGQNYGSMAECTYDIQLGGTGQYVGVFLYAPAMFGDLAAALETDQGLGQSSTGHAVEGLGDAAFVVDNATEQQSVMHVLLENDVAIEIKAPQAEQARSLAVALLNALQTAQ